MRSELLVPIYLANQISPSLIVGQFTHYIRVRYKIINDLLSLLQKNKHPYIMFNSSYEAEDGTIHYATRFYKYLETTIIYTYGSFPVPNDLNQWFENQQQLKAEYQLLQLLDT